MNGEEFVATQDGARLRASTGGQGRPVLLCHGGPGLWDYLEPVAELIEDAATVHRFDQRGCGRSTPAGPYTVEQYIDDMEALRLHFGHERWTVAGHSWGATLVLAYALRHPGRVSGLVYLCGTGLGSGWKVAHKAEAARRRLKSENERLATLRPISPRTADEEREFLINSWLPDFGWGEVAREGGSFSGRRLAGELRVQSHAVG